MAHPPLATVSDLVAWGHLPAALATLPTDVKEMHLLSASKRALTYVSKKYGLPLLAWGEDLKEAVCAIAAWTLLCVRGFNPTNAADLSVEKRHDDAWAWLRDIGRGNAELVDVVDSTPDRYEGGPLTASETRHSWLWGSDANSAGDDE